MAILNAIIGACSQGVLWAVMTLGVYLTFRILNVADLTVDGSFATGGAVSAVLIVAGWNPFVTLLIAFIAGMITGFVTGYMNTKLKIHVLLASILTQIALYSINIRIMGKANIPLLGQKTIMKGIADTMHLTMTQASLVVGLVFVAVLIAITYWFLGTEMGSSIRATGCNEKMVRALGVNTDTMKMLCLALSNGFVALSGALVAQSQGYADVQMGTGAIVIGLASIIIGEAVFKKAVSVWLLLVGTVAGSVAYRIVIAIVLQLGLKSTDLKLLTALVVAIALAVPTSKVKFFKKKNYRAIVGEENTRHSQTAVKESMKTERAN